MSLATEVERALEQASVHPVTSQQKSIAEASAMFDEMVMQGLIQPPAYSLAPLDATPARAALR